MWEVPPDQPIIHPGEAHVWRIPLELSIGQLELWWEILSTDERDRASRFHFERDRRRFIAAHGGLRLALAAHLQVAPDRLEFQASLYGKPSLGGDLTRSRLRFNLSHANQLALLAITQGVEVGVDIEFIRPDFAGEQIARRYFSAREVETLLGLPEEQRVEAFFNCWTRKEAYIKARGEGLSMPLDRFDVTLSPGEPAELLHTRPNLAEVEQWKLFSLNPGAGYVAALAAQARDLQLRGWQMQSA